MTLLDRFTKLKTKWNKVCHKGVVPWEDIKQGEFYEVIGIPPVGVSEELKYLVVELPEEVLVQVIKKNKRSMKVVIWESAGFGWELQGSLPISIPYSKYNTKNYSFTTGYDPTK